MKMQKGFTLIELIVVIVILGILAATALPKFVSLSTDARIAALNGITGAVKSAATMTYGKSLIAGVASLSASQVIINGAIASTAYGYPDTNATTGIVSLMTDNGGATTSGGNLWTLQAGCTLTYAVAASAAGIVTPPTYTQVTSGC